MKDSEFDVPAPEGQTYVCGACGKTSKTRAGDGTNSWDVSCFMHAILCYEEKQDGKWVAVEQQDDRS